MLLRLAEGEFFAMITLKIVGAIGQDEGRDGQWVDIRKGDDLDSERSNGTEMRRDSQICGTRRLLRTINALT